MTHWPHIINQRFRIITAERKRYTMWPKGYPKRPFWRLYWNAGPGGEWTSGSKTYQGSRKKLILIPPNLLVRRRLIKPHEHCYIHFSLGFPLDLYRGGVLEITAPQNIDQTMQCIAHESHSLRWQFVASTLINQVLAHLPQRNLSGLQLDSRIEALLIFMQLNTGRLITNDELAQQAHLSEPAMIRLFTQHLSRSPQAFFSDLRLDHASEMLRFRSDLTLEEIAEKTGFYDRSHFCKRFTLRYGITAAAYRKAP